MKLKIDTLPSLFYKIESADCNHGSRFCRPRPRPRHHCLGVCPCRSALYLLDCSLGRCGKGDWCASAGRIFRVSSFFLLCTRIGILKEGMATPHCRGACTIHALSYLHLYAGTCACCAVDCVQEKAFSRSVKAPLASFWNVCLSYCKISKESTYLEWRTQHLYSGVPKNTRATTCHVHVFHICNLTLLQKNYATCMSNKCEQSTWIHQEWTLRKPGG